MKRSKECPTGETLLRLAENELHDREASLVNEHLLSCERCRRLLEEYRNTLLLLAKDRISEPRLSEWQWLMVQTRAKIRGGTRVWDRPKPAGRFGRRRQVLPTWIRGTAIATAAVVALLVLWNTGLLDVGHHAREIRNTATRSGETTTRDGKYATGEKTTPPGDKRLAEDTSAPSKEAGSREDGSLFSDEMLVESDGTPLDLADITNEELYELGELSASVSAPRDYDLLLADLTEKEQAELLKELESPFSL